MQIAENVKQIQAFKAQTHSTSVGAAVDCSGFDKVAYVLDVGAFSGAGNTADLKITESATSGGAYTDITGAVFAQLSSANHNATYLGEVHVNPLKPFQKVSCTSAGTITTGALSCSALLHTGGLRKPVLAPSFNV